MKKQILIQRLEVFEKARLFWPGVKGGLETEFKAFRKRHKDWRKAVSLLLPAMKAEVARKAKDRQKGVFVPPWKNLKTWLGIQRCWEETCGTEPKPPEKPLFSRQDTRDLYECVLRPMFTPKLKDLQKDPGGYRGALWLIDEILAERKDK